MKRLLVFVFLLPIICTSQYTAIPDQNFEQALIDLDYDNMIDGQVLTSSISSITNLDVNDNSILDLTGIEDFIALKKLYCNHNQITSLNVSGCTDLTELFCNNNQLTSLDVSQNAALTTLRCSDNQLTNLDVRECTALTDLFCDNNQLKRLDVKRTLL